MELWYGCLNVLLAAADDPSALDSILATLLTILKVAIGLGLVIFVHELGHFLAAKAFDVQVDKFYVGFDVPISIGPIRFPRTLGKFRWGETEYGIGIIPLGGYVKMLGQDDDPRKAAKEAERIKQATSEKDPEGPSEVALHPRSYPAKNVFQRMVIISAGVVMNLIFAVIFAACAYGWGVPYTVPQLGYIVPGDPAFEAGVQPGGRVIGINDRVDPKLHYLEMRTAIASHGLDDPGQPLLLQVKYGDEVRQYEIVPTFENVIDRKIATIGVAPSESRKLSSGLPAIPGTPAAAAFEKLPVRGAEVIRFDGRTFPESPPGLLPTSLALQQYLSENAGKVVTLELTPEKGEEPFEVEVPPQPFRSIGIRFGYGPISAISPGSPAAAAGLQPGDRIVGINGRRDLSGMELWLIGNAASGPVEITYTSPDEDQEETVTLELLEDRAPMTSLSFGEEVGIDRLGIAFPILPTVLSAEGADSQIQPGDVLRRLVIEELPENVDLENEPLIQKMLAEGMELDQIYSPAMFSYLLQIAPPGTVLRAYVDRDSKIEKYPLEISESTEYYWPSRGINFEPVSDVHYADTVAEAFTLGFAETGRRMSDVFHFLGMLVTGKVPVDMIGGPVAIARGAGMEASRAVTRLLLFLTLLSANLAILNFLPIPALDGGHMMFLIAEAVTGRPVDEQLQMRLTLVGVVGLLSLMAFVIFNDVFQMLGPG